MKSYAPLYIFAAVALLLAGALIGKPERDAASLIAYPDTPLPALTVVTRSANTQALKPTNGITLINFFASWCGPCVDDHQQITALKAEHPNLTLHGIAWRDAVATNDKWLETHGNPFTKVWYDPEGKTAIELGIRGIPETYVVDRHGIIRAHIKGPVTEEFRRDTLSPLLKTLEST